MKSKMLLSAILFTACLVHTYCFTMNNTVKDDLPVGSSFGRNLVYKHASLPLIIVRDFSWGNKEETMKQLKGRSFKFPLCIGVSSDTSDSYIVELFQLLKQHSDCRVSRVCAQNTWIREKTLSYIAQVCPNIEELILNNNCRYDNFEQVKWENFNNLKEIKLEKTYVSAKAINKIATSCPNIETMDLSKCDNISWYDVAWEKFRNLRKIILSFTKINTEALNYIALCCPKVEIISLVGCKNISYDDVTWENFNKLKKIDLLYSNIRVEALNSISNNCPIEEIKLGNCKNVDWNKVQWSKFTKLKKVNLYWNNMDTKAFNHFARDSKIENITSLGQVGKCNNINWRKVSWKDFKKLKKINLSSTDITPDSLHEIARCCPKIKIITARCCDKINTRFAKKLAKICVFRISKEKSISFNFDF